MAANPLDAPDYTNAPMEEDDFGEAGKVPRV